MALLRQCLQEQRLRSGEHTLMPFQDGWFENETQASGTGNQPQAQGECGLRTAAMTLTSTKADPRDRVPA